MASESDTLPHSKKVEPGIVVMVAILPLFFVWTLLAQKYSNRTRLVGFGWLIVWILGFAFLSFSTAPEQSAKVAQNQPTANAVPSQADREALAEEAFKQIDQAQMNFPPLGADPTNYNGAITAAYHAWERAADAAYGADWKSIWRTKHAGSTDGCDIAHKFGMPYDACYQAAASDGDIKPLESMLMNCPSWDDPSGAIFNPHDPAACAARERAKAAAATRNLAVDPSGDSANSQGGQTTVEPAQQEAPTGQATPAEPPQQDSQSDPTPAVEPTQQPQ
jgi:hypothetical protein